MAKVKIDLSAEPVWPSICVCCGKPAVEMRQQKCKHATPLSVVAGLAGLAGGMLLFVDRVVTFSVPVCDGHTGRHGGAKAGRFFLRGLAVVAALAAVAYLASLFAEKAGTFLAIVDGCALLVVCAVALSMMDDDLKIQARLSKTALTLTGVCKEFKAAMEPGEPLVELQAVNR